jgi:pimeloyl-ACP methyl ester carboxylesterase
LTSEFLGPGDGERTAVQDGVMRIDSLPLLIAFGVPLAGCLSADDSGNLVPRTVDDDPSLSAIDIADTRLHSEAFGDPDAPVLIVLHGGPGSDYRGLLPLRVLADDGYRVVFWDQRGTGLSQRHDATSITLDTYLEDLRLVIELYAPGRPFVFIGQSWGAMYATAFIDRYGDYDGRIRGAIFTEPGAFNDRQLSEFIQRLQSSVSELRQRRRRAAKRCAVDRAVHVGSRSRTRRLPSRGARVSRRALGASRSG